jgi:hypothetical protein
MRALRTFSRREQAGEANLTGELTAGACLMAGRPAGLFRTGARAMQAKRIEVVRIYTTPAELRSMADELEALWKKARLGQDVPSMSINCEYGFEVKIVVDQEAMQRPAGE